MCANKVCHHIVGYATAGPEVSTCGAWEMGHAPAGHGTWGMPLRGM